MNKIYIKKLRNNTFSEATDWRSFWAHLLPPFKKVPKGIALRKLRIKHFPDIC